MRLSLAALLAAAMAMQPALLSAQEPAVAPPRITLAYPDLADLAVDAPVAAHVRVTEAIPLKGDQAASVPAGVTRYYVEAQVLSLIRGDQALPAQVRYLADVANEGGKTGRLKRKSEHVVFAAPVAGRPGELRLAAPDAQLPWSEELGGRVRAMLKEAVGPDAPPRIVGVGRAFHVPGTLPGESETQLFLLAADGRPISISILRRPGQEPRWAVALGEIVDEAAAAPARDSVLWYRLACTLPRSLPRQSLADADPGSAAAISADYSLVIEKLGPCQRNRRRA